MTPARGLPIAAALAALAGCGGGGTGAGGTVSVATTAPTATARDAHPPPPDAETSPRTTPATTPKAARAADGGATDVRVPASFRARAGRLAPASVNAPPFLAVSVSVASADGSAHSVVVHADRDYRFRVPAGGRGARRIPGQRAGTYAVDLDGRRAAALVIGGEPGP